MKCKNCGFENRSSVKFCEECGQALDKSALVDHSQKRRAEVIAKPNVQSAKKSANIICPACGYTNRPEVQFCEECGTVLQRSAARGTVGRASQFLLKRNIKKVAIACLAFGGLAALMFVGIDRLQYPITRGEAKDKADTIIDTYYPELTDVTPQVNEYEGENGETLQSYSYTKTITVQQDSGNTIQFSVGAVIVVDRKTGEVEVITIR